MMSRECVIALIGVGVIACTTAADPIVIRTGGGTLGELGMHEGWSMALTTEAPVVGETMLFIGSPSYRVLEYNNEQDPPVQPIPDGCFPSHPRVLAELGPWPEGSLMVLSFDGDAWTVVQTIDSLYPDQWNFSVAFASSLTVSPDGQFLIVGSTTPPSIGSGYYIDAECNVDVEFLPGGFNPKGHLDFFQWDGAEYALVNSMEGPLSGQPTARCTCVDDELFTTVQNGMGFSSDMLTFQDGLTEKVLIMSGIPWFDGNGAYPVFAAIELPDETIVIPGGDAEGLCCTQTDSFEGLTSIDCAMLGGVLIDDPEGQIMAAGGCTIPAACCVNDTCAGDMSVFECFMAIGNPAPGTSCLSDDEPCPNDSISLAPLPEGGSDPTACGRGGAFVAVYNPNDGSFSPVIDAIDGNGDPLLELGYPDWEPGDPIIGTLGLIPDPLAATGDPFPHQMMGYDVAATQTPDGTIWLAAGAPFAGGVSGGEAFGVEPDCSLYYGDDLAIGPMNGRVLIFTLDPDTMTVTYHQTLIASDGQNFHGFGSALDFDSDRLIVGAPQWYSATATGGAAYVFDLHEWGFWVQTDRLHPAENTNGARFGTAVSLYGDKLAVGAPLQDTDADGAMSGALHRFNFDDGINDWTETELLLPPQLGVAVSPNPGNQQFGRSVVISDTLVAGGGPQLVNTGVDLAGNLLLTTTGGIGVSDSRPLPDPVAAACDGDLDGNDEVNVRDLIHMLRGMSSPLLYPECDVNDDDVIDAVDLVKVIDNWGPCE